MSLTAWARPLTPRTDGAVNLGNIFLTMEDWGGVRAAAFRFGFDAATSKAHIDWASDTTGPLAGLGSSVDQQHVVPDHPDGELRCEDVRFPHQRGQDQCRAHHLLWRQQLGEPVPDPCLSRQQQAGMILDDVTITDVTPVGVARGD